MMDQMMDEAQVATGGYEICIRVDAQGAISVGAESGAAESQDAEAMPAQEGGAGYQPVGSIKEALSAALAIYKSNGLVNSAADDEQAGFQSAMGQQ